MGGVVQVDLVFEPHPTEQTHAEGEVEKPFVGDRKDDEGRCELEEDYYEAVDVVAVWEETVELRYEEGGEQCRSSYGKYAEGYTFTRLKVANAAPRDDHGE
jgi:hypothetical protein